MKTRQNKSFNHQKDLHYQGRNYFSNLIGYCAYGRVMALAQEAKAQNETRTYSYDRYIQPEEFTTYLYTRSDMDGDGYMGDEESNSVLR